jgi:hypothetical protein
MQVTSVVGPFSVLVSRNYGAAGVGSLAANGQPVRPRPAGARRPGRRRRRDPCASAQADVREVLPAADHRLADAGSRSRASGSTTSTSTRRWRASRNRCATWRRKSSAASSRATRSARSRCSGRSTGCAPVGRSTRWSAWARSQAAPHTYIGNVVEGRRSTTACARPTRRAGLRAVGLQGGLGPERHQGAGQQQVDGVPAPDSDLRGSVRHGGSDSVAVDARPVDPGHHQGARPVRAAQQAGVPAHRAGADRLGQEGRDRGRVHEIHNPQTAFRLRT